MIFVIILDSKIHTISTFQSRNIDFSWGNLYKKRKIYWNLVHTIVSFMSASIAKNYENGTFI